jgi:translation elongation factor EF-Tu-like GTPase
MTKKDDENPLEEIQKQLHDLLKNKNVQVAFAPFMESMKAKETEEKVEKTEKSEEPPPEDASRDERLDTIRSFDRRPKKFGTTWIVL